MSESTPKEQRGPTNLRIKFRSASLEQFIERYAADVSRGGIFIRTREPLAVGTQLRLELQLQDMTPLLSGEGTVIWIRENDPARPTVPPGMAVRFDSVSADTQPTLDKILAEKARMEEVGKVPAQPTGGMAVRRPSAVMTPLDSAGSGAGGPSKAPSDQTGAGGWGPPPAAAPPSSSAITRETPALAVPEAARPSPPAPAAAPAPAKTSFLASRMTPAAASPPAGPFTRARQTSTRPVPVPSALFEPPTAADIDKALSVLEEAPGAGPMPPLPSVPRFVSEDISNEPTRVADSAETAAMAAEAGVQLAAPPPPAEAGAGEGEVQLPLVVNPVEVGPGAEKGAVAVPAAPEVSRRFRAASKAYPTLQRRRGTGVVIALFLVIGAAAAAVWKLRPGSSVAPRTVSGTAATIAPAPAPPPAPTVPPPAAEVAPPAPPPAPPVVEEKKPAPEPAAAEKASDERGSHHGSHHKGHEEASSGRSSGKENAGAKGPEVRAVAAKPAETKPAETKPAEPKAAEAAPPAAEKPAPIEKPAAPAREAAAPVAEKPAEAKPTGGLLKITSSPPGADVTIDGAPVGSTPFTSKDIDPGTPHAITVKKDGFETHERMVGSSDWSRAHGSTPQSLKVNVKLRRLAGPPPADNPSGSPAEDTGGPYIKEVNPSTP